VADRNSADRIKAEDPALVRRRLAKRMALAAVRTSSSRAVHVGPFASKKEAEEARAKMKLLGLEPLLIPPRPNAGR
jgi:cell division protein FtsN